MLDKTGHLKAAQKLLGHASIQTTGDIYADWDSEQLTASLVEALESEVANHSARPIAGNAASAGISYPPEATTGIEPV